MKGIYFTTMCDIEDPEENSNPGIKKKIEQQYRLFERAGIEMSFWYVNKNNPLYRYIIRLPFYRNRYDVSSKRIKESDFIYIRKPTAINMGFIDMLRKIRQLNPCMKILLEIPTYPYDNEIQGIIRSTLKWKDQYARKKLKQYVNIILTYSDDTEIYGIKTIRLSNGVNAEKIVNDVNEFKHPSDNKIRIMACAKFNLWHGYDRAIEGLNDYVHQTGFNKNIELEFVGDGDSLNLYRQLVDKYKLQDYVVFHGKCEGERLVKIYSLCDIGLDSMGRHRSGVYYNSSLKGKEYCAYGLMIVSGVKTELDDAKDFKYYYRVPADDTPLDFNAIISFYNSVVGDDPSQTRKEIMQYAINHFSMEKVFNPVLNYVMNGS